MEDLRGYQWRISGDGSSDRSGWSCNNTDLKDGRGWPRISNQSSTLSMLHEGDGWISWQVDIAFDAEISQGNTRSQVEIIEMSKQK